MKFQSLCWCPLCPRTRNWNILSFSFPHIMRTTERALKISSFSGGYDVGRAIEYIPSALENSLKKFFFKCLFIFERERDRE